MRRLVCVLVITLAFSVFVQSYPAARAKGEKNSRRRERPRLIAREGQAVAMAGSGYKAIQTLEHKLTIAAVAAGSLVTLLGAGVVGLQITDHNACKAIQKQEETMQRSWDTMHPDGFVPNGDSMRAATFDCATQERGLKALKSYANSYQWY